MATNAALNAKQEVRITFQNNVLKDTEAIISKNGGDLNVTFITRSDESANILNVRGGDLRSQLMERLTDIQYVDVEVEHQQSERDAQDDSRRHQQGRQEQDQEQDEDNA